MKHTLVLNHQQCSFNLVFWLKLEIQKSIWKIDSRNFFLFNIYDLRDDWPDCFCLHVTSSLGSIHQCVYSRMSFFTLSSFLKDSVAVLFGFWLNLTEFFSFSSVYYQIKNQQWFRPVYWIWFQEVWCVNHWHDHMIIKKLSTKEL